MATVERLTATTYADFGKEGTRLVFLYASWAGPARLMAPVVDEIANRLPADVRIGMLDDGASNELVWSLTQAVPSMLLLRDGQRVAELVGHVPASQVAAWLAGAGVVVTAAAPTGAMPRLEDHASRFNAVQQLERADLVTQIRTMSAAAQQVTNPVELEPLVDIAWYAIRELPAVARVLQDTALDEERPTHERLGALAGLLYGAAPIDAVPDTMPGGYGLLDDWLVMNATRWTYVAAPAENDVARLTQLAGYVWLSLPPAVAPALRQFIERIEQESLALRQMPESQARELLAKLLATPAPVVFAVPPVEVMPGEAGSLGGWSTNSAGAIWGSGDGNATYMRFEGGGSVGMVNGRIVGGP
jgi:thioredoxin 1